MWGALTYSVLGNRVFFKYVLNSLVQWLLVNSVTYKRISGNSLKRQEFLCNLNCHEFISGVQYSNITSEKFIIDAFNLIPGVIKTVIANYSNVGDFFTKFFLQI